MKSNSKYGLIFLRKHNWLVGVALLTYHLGYGNFQGRLDQKARANVVFIITDDQGATDLGVYGCKDIQTPNMDKLLKSGVRFTQFYANAPTCSPTRASVLTGKYPAKAGLPYFASSKKGEGLAMPTEQFTMAEMMKEAGYVTAMIGKWHVGYKEGTLPNDQGFDYSFGFMGGLIDNYSHYHYLGNNIEHDLWENKTEVFNPGEYFPNLMTKKALDFVENTRNRPFFLYFSLNLPHYPLQGERKWYDVYRDLPLQRREYAAALSTADEKIGQLINGLKESGNYANTIFVFMSDNGHSTEERANFGGGSSDPYRGAKFSMFEGGIRVPAGISWEGHIEQNQVRNQFAAGTDWMPTIANLCGIHLKNRSQIDGKDLTPILFNKKSETPHKTYFWHSKIEPWLRDFDFYQWTSEEETNYQSVIRKGDFKLIINPVDTGKKEELDDDDRLFLSKMDDNPYEMKNKALEFPKEVKRMRYLFEKWLKTQ